METSLRIRFGEFLWEHVFRPWLFEKDAESAHGALIAAMKKNIGLAVVLTKWCYRSPYWRQPIDVGGILFLNPVRLEAGFDKHFEAIPALAAAGFGSIVCGTATSRPQEGNPKPRVWRYPDRKAVCNSYGYNSIGVLEARRNAQQAFADHRIECPIGWSFGRNKETGLYQEGRRNILKAVVGDYINGFRNFWPMMREIDYGEPGLSSPNTPGLRDVFDHFDEWADMFKAGVLEITGGKMPKFVLKLPPDDMSGAKLEKVVEAAIKYGFVAIAATNTSSDATFKESWGIEEPGGVSGAPLRERANAVIKETVAIARGRIPVIGVGGVMTSEDAQEKLGLRAKALGLYSGLVYDPLLLPKILKRLAA